MVSRSAEYYRTHPKAREKKQEYDKNFNQQSVAACVYDG